MNAWLDVFEASYRPEIAFMNSVSALERRCSEANCARQEAFCDLNWNIWKRALAVFDLTIGFAGASKSNI
jgi:hypothetical protein